MFKYCVKHLLTAIALRTAAREGFAVCYSSISRQRRQRKESAGGAHSPARTFLSCPGTRRLGCVLGGRRPRRRASLGRTGTKDERYGAALGFALPPAALLAGRPKNDGGSRTGQPDSEAWQYASRELGAHTVIRAAPERTRSRASKRPSRSDSVSGTQPALPGAAADQPLLSLAAVTIKYAWYTSG